MVDLLAATLLAFGVVLTLIATVGLQRFDDVFARMHAATKPATLGLLLVVLAAMLRATDAGAVVKLAIVIVFQFITAPIGMHLLSRAVFRGGGDLGERTRLDTATAPVSGEPEGGGS